MMFHASIWFSIKCTHGVGLLLQLFNCSQSHLPILVMSLHKSNGTCSGRRNPTTHGTDVSRNKLRVRNVPHFSDAPTDVFGASSKRSENVQFPHEQETTALIYLKLINFMLYCMQSIYRFIRFIRRMHSKEVLSIDLEDSSLSSILAKCPVQRNWLFFMVDSLFVDQDIFETLLWSEWVPVDI